MRLRYPATAAASAALILTSESAAYADGSVVDPTRGPAAWFKHNGNVFWSQYTKADGHSAVTRVDVPSIGIADNLQCTPGWGKGSA